MNITIWDLLIIIKDIKPTFCVFKNGTFINAFTYEGLATNNAVNQLFVKNIHTQYGDGHTIYVIDCEGIL